MRPPVLYDATLREGAQSSSVSFSLEDKLRIVHMLDDLGVPYIEAGNPGSNPKDAAFYERTKGLSLRTARLAAFGPTCRLGHRPEEDEGLRTLLAAGTPVVTVFGKSWDFHATHVLGATLQQNLDIIHDTIAYIVAQGREAVFDAEHFFDGMKTNPIYAMQVLAAAHSAGATYLALCDTNGGCMPSEIGEMTRQTTALYGRQVGIHAHNDAGMADANTIAAIQCGAGMAQVTANALGERCGNADLFTTAANLQLKLHLPVLPESSLPKLRSASLLLDGMLNRPPNKHKPYVGANAFTHKAGMHIDGVRKHPTTFEHTPPESVGNERTFVLSEIAGRSAVIAKIAHLFPDVDKKSPEVGRIVERIKEREFEGYLFEGADASFELEVRRILAPYKPFFELHDFMVVIAEPAEQDDRIATATIEINVGDQIEITADHGNGPVNALDRAARKALERFFPNLKQMYLSDYKVRVLDSPNATASRVRVLIESTDETESWTTVGVSADVVGASWAALTDSLEYKLLKDQLKGV